MAHTGVQHSFIGGHGAADGIDDVGMDGIDNDINTGAKLLQGLGTVSMNFTITTGEATKMMWSTRKCITDFCHKPAKNSVPDKLYHEGTKLQGPVCAAHHQMLRRHFQIDNNNPHVKCRNGRVAKKCKEALDAMLVGMRNREREAASRAAPAPAPAPAAAAAPVAAAAPAAYATPGLATPMMVGGSMGMTNELHNAGISSMSWGMPGSGVGATASGVGAVAAAAVRSSGDVDMDASDGEGEGGLGGIWMA